jgi:hypothetical protein
MKMPSNVGAISAKLTRTGKADLVVRPGPAFNYDLYPAALNYNAFVQGAHAS